MRVFVSGVSGGLGLRVIRTLARTGHAVLAQGTGDDEAWVERAGGTAVAVDPFDGSALGAILAGCDAAICLMGASPALGRLRTPTEWEPRRRQNETAERIAASSITYGVSCYVCESTAAVYCDGGADWLDEDAPVGSSGWAPLNDALDGEAFAHLVTESGRRGVVLRFAALYANDEPQSIELAMRMRRRRAVLVGGGRNYLSTIHAEDAAEAMVAALEAPAGVYNVGDDNPLPLRENLAALADAIGAPPLRRLPGIMGPAVLGGAWEWLRRSVRLESRRLREATGWAPIVPDVRAGWARVAAEWAAEIHRG